MFWNKKKSRQSREIIHKQESYYKQEIAAVALAACMLFLTLACVSYNPHDATLFYFSSTSASVTNWSGLCGAHVSAMLFFLMGCATYLLVFSLALPFIMLVKKIPLIKNIRRLVGLTTAVFIMAMLCELYKVKLGHILGGGYLGTHALALVTLLTGQVGQQIILWGCLWVCMCSIVRIPLLKLLSMYSIKGITTATHAIKQCFKRPLQTPVITSAACKTTVFETTDESIQIPEQVNNSTQQIAPTHAQTATLSNEQQERLASCPLRTQSEHAKIFSIPIIKLPNTVLQNHLFTTDAMPNKNIYTRINQATSSHQKHVFRLPDVSLFKKTTEQPKNNLITEQMQQQAKKVEEKLLRFGIKGSVVAINPGPVVTMFEYKPDIDSKISRIVALEDDLAMALTAQSMRILAPIPGKNVIGFEIANAERDDVAMRALLQHPIFANSKAQLPIILGVDIAGNPMVIDLASTPHLLVGGATGSGKSVGLNVMLLSLLCKLTPDELKLILIDPKRLEFTPYADIPHLLFPIITQPARAAAGLAWIVQEMEARYDAMASVGVRGLSEYKKLLADPIRAKDLRPMPYLVVIIDELADLMMAAGKEIEINLVRIAQMARAAGIHVIVATQRPSVDVVTGLIKVNFPSRVAFRVSSKVDSRTILDMQGAEKLLGKGDMLFMHASSPDLKRIHGAYVSDGEVERVADFLRDQRMAVYQHLNETTIKNQQTAPYDVDDELYGQIKEFIQTMDEISISMIQRHYRIGFNRSARLIEKLELDGLVAPSQGSKPRKVLR